jgi:NADPH:quinone reductase-like Zn-dependent oxidoreductase
MTMETAATIPEAAIVAIQGLRLRGGRAPKPGDRVLVNGASGSVGPWAVQIAKALGAEVTAVCRTEKMEFVRSIGADHVIDYTQEDFTRNGRRYDLVLDIAGNRSWSELERVLSKRAAVVVVGGPKTNRFVGPLGQALKLRLASLGGSRNVAAPFLAKMNKEDMAVLQNLLADGKVTPVIDRRYELSEVPEALSYLGEGHAQGKIVINV